VNLDAAHNARDRRLRKKLLFVLYMSRGHSQTGFLSGRFLADQAGSLVGRGQGFESDGHAMGLVRDLVNASLVTEKPLGFLRRGERFGLDHVQFAITDAGTVLCIEDDSRPPHPLVDDERQVS
jgi:hypothetical protein